MFFKGIKPLIRDAVDIGAGDELVRWEVQWKRPNKAARKALMTARMHDVAVTAGMEARLKALQDSMSADGAVVDTLMTELAVVMDESMTKLAVLEAAQKSRMIESLHSIDGVQDEDGNPVAYSAEVLAELLQWDEIARPLLASFGRLIDGGIVEEAAGKNSLTLAGTGQEFPPEVLVKQEPLPSPMLSTTESAAQ